MTSIPSRLRAALAMCGGAALLAAGLAASPPARADTPIALYKSYAGRLNFTGLQKTMRTGSNGSNACSINTGTLSATLAGIPTGAKIVSAQLYWAGSGSSPDYTVLMDGASVSAPTNRRFTSATVGYNYFSGAADVTAQVTAKRNATYTFGGLTVDNSSTFCGVEGVLGGFSLLAIYSVPAPAETFRVLNLYEGFQYIRTYGTDNIKVNLNLSNFKTPTPLGTATGRIAHVTWEGDTTLSGGGENLKFNGAEMVDSANPSGNQFNSTSNIGGTVDNASYGIDFDSYVLASPKLFAGQTTATMLYESGQDMVLLNAEIVSVPNVDVADLSLALTSSGTPARGSVMNLIHAVTNNGPLPDAGPITVKHTLANGLDFVSASGTGWSCSQSGQVLTCISPETLDVGETAPALTISARISLSAPGTMTTNATVGGLQFDNDLANNAASKTISFSSAKYVFTDSPCRTGITPGSPGQCNYLSMPTQQAAVNGTVYVTAIDNTALDLNFKTIVPPSTTVNLQFSMKCVNPTTGAGGIAKLKGTSLKACIGATATQTAAQWQSIPIVFDPSSATAQPLSFVYSDVGMMELMMAETASALAQVSTSGQFVVRPYKFALSTPLANPAGAVEPSKMTADIGPFWKAGLGFTMDVVAQNFDGNPTPNFGRETTPQGVELITTAAIDSTNFAIPGDSNSETLPFADMEVEAGQPVPRVEGSFAAFSAGAASGASFTYAEAGIVNVRAHLKNSSYLGVEDVTSNGIALGRFYPSYFTTALPIAISCAAPHPLDCKNIGLHYSRQPIQTIVTAYNAAGQVTKFYQGKFVKSPKLLPFTTMGGATQASMGTLNPSPIADAANAFVQGIGTAWPSFDYAASTYAPVDIYLRASDADLVTSNRSSLSVEGGTRIVRGRLLVENAFGSELVALPVTGRAQYWTGSTATNGRWVDSLSDSISILPPPAAGSGIVILPHSVTGNQLVASYTQCKNNMSTCNSGTPFPDPKLTLAMASLNNGLLKFKLAATGKTGSVDLGVNGPVWLPPTAGRLTFGVYKATPLIYIREIF
jgi:MSHA biogenesis protein MshQ